MSENNPPVGTSNVTDMHYLEIRLVGLRQDEIIYAVKACALNLACILAFFVAVDYLELEERVVVSVVAFVVAAAYTLYMGAGNMLRRLEIKHLERQLQQGNRKFN